MTTDTTLLAALIEVAKLAREYVEDIPGGCDHDNGLCVCEELAAIACVEAFIAFRIDAINTAKLVPPQPPLDWDGRKGGVSA